MGFIFTSDVHVESLQRDVSEKRDAHRRLSLRLHHQSAVGPRWLVFTLVFVYLCSRWLQHSFSLGCSFGSKPHWISRRKIKALCLCHSLVGFLWMVQVQKALCCFRLLVLLREIESKREHLWTSGDLLNRRHWLGDQSECLCCRRCLLGAVRCDGLLLASMHLKNSEVGLHAGDFLDFFLHAMVKKHRAQSLGSHSL